MIARTIYARLATGNCIQNLTGKRMLRSANVCVGVMRKSGKQGFPLGVAFVMRKLLLVSKYGNAKISQQSVRAISVGHAKHITCKTNGNNMHDETNVSVATKAKK